MPQPSDLPPSQHCIARALYDNVADSPDELEFKKGDNLIVLEQNAGNIEGWWLCSLKGRQGICPANRLRLIPGVFEDTGQSYDINFLQKQGIRRSWHIQPNQVVTPKKFNDVYLYDMPPRSSPLPVASPSPGLSPGLSPRDQCGDYDVPPRAIPVSNENFRNCPRCSPAPSCASPVNRDFGEAYDVPRPLHNNPLTLTPSSSASSLTADSLSSSNRSSLANMPDYDVPKPHNRTVLNNHHQIYDVPPSHPPKELPLEINSALENLERLQTDTTSAISKLLGFVGPQWRSHDKLESNMMEIKLAIMRLKTSLHDLAEFGEGTLGNAARASDKNLAGKLTPLVLALKKSDSLVQEACRQLNKQNWSVDVLSRSEADDKCHKPDELEQLVACSRALTEDIRQIASFIQGNGTLLFKRESGNNIEWSDEHDYVSLESKETTNKNRIDILNDLPQELRKGFNNCIKNADDLAFDEKSTELASDDKQLLSFYAAQLVTHHEHLTQAIDAFLDSVEHNQPPKVFLAHGKFVVLSAHKLVHIGDTVHRNVSCKDIKERSLNCSNSLAEALATSVNKTKHAALQFPSVTAVQEMVDSIVDISHMAKDLKVCLVQAAAPL
ncbi:breast cancer anti-estrogen resistance protein 1 isoform X3 [Aethina tumida]|uniref:breast cancer anti-estrogen resistance protein 1 isoform X3 n=1 Tax=Aethina tumida TaxID=116153 RepID=UPI002148803A|nr:breast cancer anti-estrogen resistance protein 1 isoform X3 [Aethina tumida]